MLVFALIVALSQTQPGPPRPSQPAPIPPASTWDGVADFEDVVTDPETGQITYPMGQQPEDALSRGCVFGLWNVRCPKPFDPEALRGLLAANRAQAAGTNGRIEWDVDLNRTASSDPAARIDCVNNEEDARPGQRRCTFDEALHNSYLDRDAQARTGGPLSDEDAARGMSLETRTSDRGRLGFRRAPGASSNAGDDETPGAPADRNGCRRIEYRYPDGSGGGVRWECTHTTGSGPAADAVREALRPSPK